MLFLVIDVAPFLSGCKKAQEITKVEKTVVVQCPKIGELVP
jgi:hypothetical protein